MSKKDYLTVEQLNALINQTLLDEVLLHSVPVVGEVSGCSVVGGHCYFTLKDAKAQIKVCFFNCPTFQIPKNGDNVLVIGAVDYFIKGGQLSLKAYQIKPFGLGQLHVALEQLKAKLSAEGYFAEGNKKPIPQYCKKIALITSVQGAAMQDFLSTIQSYNCPVDISVLDVRVQGEYCVTDIIQALQSADEGGFDAIVLARGGGSFEDLYCFNNERIVKTIFQLQTPIISAIGHQTDFTLCDFVADYRAITPTAAAEKIAYDIFQIKININKLIENIKTMVGGKYIFAKHSLVNKLSSLQNSANLLLNNQYKKISNSLNLMKIYQQYNFDAKYNKIADYIAKLDILSPTKLLKNGYFRILKDNEMIFDGKVLQKNDPICILGADVKITAKVDSVEVK